MVPCIYTPLYQWGKKVWKANNVLLLIPSWCGSKSRRAEPQKWLEKYFMQNIKRRCFCITDKDDHNFVLSIIDSPSEELEDICPSDGSCQEWSLYPWPPEKVCLWKSVFLCSGRSTLWEGHILHKTSNSSHFTPTSNSAHALKELFS